MSWESVAVQAVTSIVAAVVAIWISSRTNRQQRRLAQVAAQQSGESAQKADVLAERLAMALEAVGHKGVRWHLQLELGSIFRLTNVGDATASDVKVAKSDAIARSTATVPCD